MERERPRETEVRPDGQIERVARDRDKEKDIYRERKDRETARGRERSNPRDGQTGCGRTT